jgi:hypothetical protein
VSSYHFNSDNCLNTSRTPLTSFIDECAEQGSPGSNRRCIRKKIKKTRQCLEAMVTFRRVRGRQSRMNRSRSRRLRGSACTDVTHM